MEEPYAILGRVLIEYVRAGEGGRKPRRRILALRSHLAENQHAALLKIDFPALDEIHEPADPGVKAVLDAHKLNADVAAHRAVGLLLLILSQPDHRNLGVDLRPDHVSYGRREHFDAHAPAEIFLKLAALGQDMEILRAELTSPLRDAVGLVEDHVLKAAVAFHARFKGFDEHPGAEALGGYVQKRDLAAADAPVNGFGFLIAAIAA